MTSGASQSGPQGHYEDDTEFHLPADHWPLPELTHVGPSHPEPSQADFVAVSKTPEYAKVRSTFRSFAFPMTIAALVSYFTYVVLSIYAIDFMKQPFVGLKGLNLGMALGLFQFAIVWIWTALYVRFMNNKIDPIAGELKTRLENGATR